MKMPPHPPSGIYPERKLKGRAPLPKEEDVDLKFGFEALSPRERVASPFALPLANGSERSEKVQDKLHEPGDGYRPKFSGEIPPPQQARRSE